MMTIREDLSFEPDYKSVSKMVLRRSNIGTRYWGVDLNNELCRDADYAIRLREFAKEMPENEKAGASLLLHGPHGSGKTSAACRLLVEAMARGPVRCYFIPAFDVDWFARRRDEELPTGTRVWDLLTWIAQFLVIDDLGVEDDAEWKAPQVEHLISVRYNWELPTYVTTNLDIGALLARCPRIRHLLGDTFDAVEVSGVNWRG